MKIHKGFCYFAGAFALIAAYLLDSQIIGTVGIQTLWMTQIFDNED